MRTRDSLLLSAATLCAMGVASALLSAQSAPATQAPAPAAAQAPAPAAPPGRPPLTPEQQAALAKQQEETKADHAQMMQQLGIKALRPGPSGQANAPNAANYDEATANPYPKQPEVLTLKNGTKVTTKVQWETRRKEIMEDFEREVLGRIPKDVPKVTWKVEETVNTTVGSVPVLGRKLVGHVDNSAYPAINVDISLILVQPAPVAGKPTKPVPVMVMFRGGALPGPPGSPALDFLG